MKKYYHNEPKLNGVYSKSNLPKIKNGAYVINLDLYESIETHFIAIYIKAKNVTYYYSFGI